MNTALKQYVQKLPSKTISNTKSGKDKVLNQTQYFDFIKDYQKALSNDIKSLKSISSIEEADELLENGKYVTELMQKYRDKF